MGYFDLVIFLCSQKEEEEKLRACKLEARRMSSTMPEDLEELDYMREGGREGRWEGGSVESFAKDSVLVYTLCLFFLMKTHLFMCYVENTPFHIFLKIHLFIFMNIIYVCTYIYIRTYI